MAGTPGNGIPHYDLHWGDVHIRNVSTNIRDYNYGTEFGGNSIFIFEIADLCIAHLTHLHHTLTPEHLAELGEIDVLIAPVDGAYTLGQRDMLEVIDQIKAPLTIPMHYFTPRVLDHFLALVGNRYPVKQVDGHHITLSRSSLPKDFHYSCGTPDHGRLARSTGAPRRYEQSFWLASSGGFLNKRYSSLSIFVIFLPYSVWNGDVGNRGGCHGSR